VTDTYIRLIIVGIVVILLAMALDYLLPGRDE
jgi:hypothetical protein